MAKNAELRLEDEDTVSSGTALPVQFYAPLGVSRQPERALLLAVLENAVDSFRANVLAPDRRRRRLYEEAEEWFASDDTSHAFAFESICDALDIDAAFVRDRLFAWREHQLARVRAGSHFTGTIRRDAIRRDAVPRRAASS